MFQADGTAGAKVHSQAHVVPTHTRTLRSILLPRTGKLSERCPSVHLGQPTAQSPTRLWVPVGLSSEGFEHLLSAAFLPFLLPLCHQARRSPLGRTLRTIEDSGTNL